MQGNDIAKSREGSPGPLGGLFDPLTRLVGLPPATPTTATGPTTADPASSAAVGGPSRAYSLSFVLVVALVAFLCGSLLRSFLTPADFVLDTGSAGGSVDLKLLQALHPDRRWRQARRLFELRFPSLVSPSDIMCATVRKQSYTAPLHSLARSEL